ncbi:MAG: ROK family protein [Planctomycetota bacterium]|nr:MAG: ROK family protein [Planctomycetota bacterium]
MSRIGLDVGGTKSEVLALRADGSEALRTRVASPRDYGALVDAIAALVAQADSALGVRGAPVGIGAPGSPNPQTGLHRNSNLLCMNGKPFASDIATRLARPVRVTNDANCLALSEAIDGAAAGQGAVVFGVILGTGVGGGVVVRGDVVDGGNGIAGEWGHNPLPGLGDAEAAAHRCYCGKSGCLEQFLSGPALERRYAQASGTQRALAEIAARAAAGTDAHAVAMLDWFVHALARSISVVVNIIDPHAIVLGGGVSNIPGLAERVQAALPALVFSDECHTPVFRAKHGDSSGIRGAAMLPKSVIG